MSATEWLQHLRDIGVKLSVPDDAARQRYATEFMNKLIPPTVEGIRAKFGTSRPGASMDENIQRVREQEAAARTKGMLTEWIFAEEWARSAFAQVCVSPKLFASLAETKIPREAIPDLGVPWDCFIVRIPDDFAPAPIRWGTHLIAPPAYMSCKIVPRDGDNLLGAERPVSRVVEAGESNEFLFDVKPANARGAAMWCRFKQVSDLLSSDLRMNTWDGGSWVGDSTPAGMTNQLSPTRAALHLAGLLRRAFVGVVLELMNAPEAHSHARTSTGRRNGRATSPRSFTITLTRPVVVDCRERVKALLQGRRPPRRSGHVQVLVRGHWKNQRCGPGGTERKFIHIEPYWRGPEDAPIAVRPHVLKGDKGGVNNGAGEE